MLLKKERKVKVTRIIQKEGQFVVLAPGIYREGFNSGYNIAKAAHFATFSLPEAGRIVTRSQELGKPLMECTVPVAIKLWNEASLITLSEVGMSLSDYYIGLAK